jgi:1-acyl-sn-glycerol-3-phosphate acyltransferase
VIKPFRVAFRLCRIGNLLLFAGLHFILLIWLAGKSSDLRARARWLQHWCVNWLRIMNCRVTRRGAPPTRGVLASNHLSYMDVLAYGSVCPMVFLSKSEVRSWPVVGVYTRIAGTLFIRRGSKEDVVRLGADMVPVVNAGLLVALFLEGTSSDGQTVLPFRSSLLAPAAKHHWPATAAWIHYAMADGSVQEDVCYWRDMTFLPHILKLLSRKGLEAVVSFDEPLTEKLDRKAMAAELHARVCRLKDEYLLEVKDAGVPGR